jgi:hypothetical protein
MRSTPRTGRAERAGGADLVEAHEPRVARHVSGDYGG